MDIDPNIDLAQFEDTHLYDHKFDIDDVITALCHGGNQGMTGRFLLDTQNKQLIHDEGEHSALQEGDQNGHIFEIIPLPLEAFQTELRNHPRRDRLSPEDNAKVTQLTESLTHISDLVGLFEEGRVGGWFRERVKEEALEWLDARSLIPPSMLHVYDGSIYNAPPARTTIQFTEDE